MPLPLPFTQLSAVVLLLLLSLYGSILLFSRLFRRYVRSQEVDAPYVGLIIIAMGVFCFFMLWFGFAFQDTSDDFLRALHNDDKASAFNLLDANLQNEMGGLDGFSVWAENWQPESWFFWSSCSTFRVARSNGTGRFTNQQGFSVNFHMQKVENEWLIQGLEFGSPGPAFQAGTLNELDCLAD